MCHLGPNNFFFKDYCTFCQMYLPVIHINIIIIIISITRLSWAMVHYRCKIESKRLKTPILTILWSSFSFYAVAVGINYYFIVPLKPELFMSIEISKYMNSSVFGDIM